MIISCLLDLYPDKQHNLHYSLYFLFLVKLTVYRCKLPNIGPLLIINKKKARFWQLSIWTGRHISTEVAYQLKLDSNKKNTIRSWVRKMRSKILILLLILWIINIIKLLMKGVFIIITIKPKKPNTKDLLQEQRCIIPWTMKTSATFSRK